RQVPVNAAKQSSHKAAASVSVAMHRVKRLERELKARTPPIKVQKANDSKSVSDEEDSPVNDRFMKSNENHAVPPLYTGNYMPPRADNHLQD
nr:hypothetical protein [Tanacetum cinerariifolium]